MGRHCFHPTLGEPQMRQGYCFECEANLIGPFCPVCNPPTITGEWYSPVSVIIGVVAATILGMAGGILIAPAFYHQFFPH